MIYEWARGVLKNIGNLTIITCIMADDQGLRDHLREIVVQMCNSHETV